MPQKEWLFDLQGDERESCCAADRQPRRLNRLWAVYAAKLTEMEVSKRGWIE